MTKMNHAPALDYYTLKQAATELNQYFNRVDIDENYLVQLGAAGKTILSLPSFDKYPLAMPLDHHDKDTFRERKAMAEALTENKAFFLFYNIHARDLMKLSVTGDFNQSDFRDFYIYDPWHVFDDFNKHNPLMSFMVIDEGVELDHPKTEEIKSKVLNQLKNTPRIDDTPFIKTMLEINDVLFGFSEDGVTNFRVVKFYDERKGKLGLDYFKIMTITKSDLFIIKPELDRLISGELHKLGTDNFNTLLQPPVLPKKVRFKPAVLSALLQLKIDPLKIPSQKSGTKGVRAQVKEHLAKDPKYADLAAEEETFKKYWQELLGEGVLVSI